MTKIPLKLENKSMNIYNKSTLKTYKMKKIPLNKKKMTKIPLNFEK